MIADVERLLRSLAAVEGVTSAAGTVNTFVDAARVEGVGYWNGKIIVALTGSARGQVCVIVDDNGAGTLTVRPALSAAPGANQVYIILNNCGDLVPAADSLENYQPRDVIGNKTDAATADDMSALATASLVAEIKRVLLRMSTNAFTATVQGVAHTELDAILASLATYLAAAGAAWSVQVNGNLARTNLEQTIEDFLVVFGCDGANVFNPTIQGVARTDLDTALYQLATYIAALGAAYSATINPGGAARTNVEQCFEDLSDMLAGTTGIITYPARALPANGVSMAKVIRYTAERKPEFDALSTGTHTTASGNEETIVTTAIGVPGIFYMDFDLNNLALGDDFTFRVYKRVDGANYRLKSEQQFIGAPTIKVLEIEGVYLDSTMQMRVTVQRNSGTNRAFTYIFNTYRQPVA